MPSLFKPACAVLCLVFGLCFSVPNAHTDTVFSDLTSNCACGLGGQLLGEEFTPGANFQLTDVVAKIETFGGATTLDFFIYSNSGGLPGTQLTSLTGSVLAAGSLPPFGGLITSGAHSSPLTLTNGSSAARIVARLHPAVDAAALLRRRSIP